MNHVEICVSHCLPVIRFKIFQDFCGMDRGIHQVHLLSRARPANWLVSEHREPPGDQTATSDAFLQLVLVSLYGLVGKVDIARWG